MMNSRIEKLPSKSLSCNSTTQWRLIYSEHGFFKSLADNFGKYVLTVDRFR